MMEGSYVVHHRPLIKEVVLSIGLLVSGVLGIAFGILMAANRVGGDRTRGVFFALLGSCCSYRGSTTRGSPTTLTRDTKVSHLLTFLKYEVNFLLAPCATPDVLSSFCTNHFSFRDNRFSFSVN